MQSLPWRSVRAAWLWAWHLALAVLLGQEALQGTFDPIPLTLTLRWEQGSGRRDAQM